MNTAAAYQGLATLFRYPEAKDEMLNAYWEVATALDAMGADSPAAPLGTLIEGSTLAELQEGYVASFDFNPAAAPYLGHHLYGDTQKKGGYLIRMKQEFGVHEFLPEEGELPDHLGVILGFLAHLARKGEDEYRSTLVRELVLPGVRRLTAGNGRSSSPWTTLAETAELFLSADCKEVSPC